MTQNPASTAGPVKETIIRTLDEGAGSVTLSAVPGPTGWAAFSVVSNDHPPVEMLGDDFEAELETFVKVTGPVETWEGALELLDGFLWHILTPDYVHPDFRQAVLAVVRERAADKDDTGAEFVGDWLPKWESKCSSSEGV
jgi:hypothetical protein